MTLGCLAARTEPEPAGYGCFPGPGIQHRVTQRLWPQAAGCPHTRRAADLATGLQEAGCSPQEALGEERTVSWGHRPGRGPVGHLVLAALPSRVSTAAQLKEGSSTALGGDTTLAPGFSPGATMVLTH